MEYLILIISFVVLVKGADIFIAGSASIAKKFNIPDLVIGLTIVALGTSAPELAVSAIASIQKQNEMAVSNILGSNIFNIMIVLGVCAIVMPIKFDKEIFVKEYIWSILATAALLLMICDVYVNGSGSINLLSRSEGILLMVSFFLYMYSVLDYSIHSMEKMKKRDAERAENLRKDVESSREKIKEEVEDVIMLPTGRSIIYIIIGLIAVCGGGEFVVESASAIALKFHVSKTLIGLTIVGIGTSLPELVTSVIACRRGNSSLALGNVVGSNVFNILFTLGFSSILSPIKIQQNAIYDTIVLIAFTVLIFIIAFWKKRISKATGIMMCILYAIFLVWICVRPQ